MAQGGGGSWKVAYADFVTAMMAFFMVMWITAQDQKVKQAVSRYFNTPMSIDSFGHSKSANKPGAIFESPSTGSAPGATGSSMAKGRAGRTVNEPPSPATKAVSDWLVTDPERRKFWDHQAKRSRDAAERTQEVKEKHASADKVAIDRLARQLRQETTESIPPEAKGLYETLLLKALQDVNWKMLAEDLVKK